MGPGLALLLGLSAALLAPDAARALPPEEEPIEELEPVEPYAPVRMPDDHDPRRAAHPLRIVAYALHPVGVALDYLIVRPAVWTARREPFRTIFGYEDN
jgi:hypothetical protein